MPNDPVKTLTLAMAWSIVLLPLGLAIFVIVLPDLLEILGWALHLMRAAAEAVKG